MNRTLHYLTSRTRYTVIHLSSSRTVRKEQWDRGRKERHKIFKLCSCVHWFSVRETDSPSRTRKANRPVAVLNIEKVVMAILAQQSMLQSLHLGMVGEVIICEKNLPSVQQGVTGKPWVLWGRTKIMFLWTTHLEVFCWNGKPEFRPWRAISISHPHPFITVVKTPCLHHIPAHVITLCLLQSRFS